MKGFGSQHHCKEISYTRIFVVTLLTTWLCFLFFWDFLLNTMISFLLMGNLNASIGAWGLDEHHKLLNRIFRSFTIAICFATVNTASIWLWNMLLVRSKTPTAVQEQSSSENQ